MNHLLIFSGIAAVILAVTHLLVSRLSFLQGIPLVVNDYGLHEHYARQYRRTGRWIVSLAIVMGWLLGVLTPVSMTGIALIFAFIAGGNILNILKEELPEERKSNYWAFFAGIGGYTILLLLVA